MTRKMVAALVALMLVPALALAESVEGTVLKVDAAKREIVVNTKAGEKTVQISTNTEGLENAMEGANVRIEYSKKGDRLIASKITEAAARTTPR